MADFVHRAALSSEPLALDTIKEYDLYCHYVAGLVGEGLSRLFSATGKESPSIAHQLELSNSLGTFLQKTNIIRDFREDAEQQRFFWPREIWGSAEFGQDGQTPATCILQLLKEPQRANWVQSAMILDALRHACDALDYLRLLKNQSVFNFAAIPATMAIATLDLCFMNSEMFQRNIKIRKAKAAEVRVFSSLLNFTMPDFCAQLIMRSTNPRECALIFKHYARSIHAKASPSDPNFLRISVACAKIEHWAEHNYPSFVRVSPPTSSSAGLSFNPADARSRVAIADAETDKRAHEEKRHLEVRGRGGNGTIATSGPQNQGPPWEVLLFVGGAMFLILALSVGIVLAVIYFTT